MLKGTHVLDIEMKSQKVWQRPEDHLRNRMECHRWYQDNVPRFNWKVICTYQEKQASRLQIYLGQMIHTLTMMSLSISNPSISYPAKAANWVIQPKIYSLLMPRIKYHLEWRQEMISLLLWCMAEAIPFLMRDLTKYSKRNSRNMASNSQNLHQLCTQSCLD